MDLILKNISVYKILFLTFVVWSVGIIAEYQQFNKDKYIKDFKSKYAKAVDDSIKYQDNSWLVDQVSALAAKYNEKQSRKSEWEDDDSVMMSYDDLKKMLQPETSFLFKNEYDLLPLAVQKNNNFFREIVKFIVPVQLTGKDILNMTPPGGDFNVAELKQHLKRKRFRYVYDIADAQPELSVRRDRVLLASVLWIGILSILYILRKGLGEGDILGDIDHSDFNCRITKDQANQIYRSAYFMLTAGVLSAFMILIVIFIKIEPIARPTGPTNDVIKLYFANHIWFFFLSFIAMSVSFFFFRQYRRLMDDYKEFFYLYLRRSNLLKASKVYESSGHPEKDAELILAYMILDHKNNAAASANSDDDVSHPLLEILKTLIDKIIKK